MATPDPENNLIYEHLPFERRWMRFERTMWLLLSLILLAACFGMLGKGAYARETVRSGALTIEYDRILRSRTQTDLVVTLDSAATATGKARLLITGSLLDKTRLYDVVPKPASEELLEKGSAMIFNMAPGRPATVTLIQKVEGIGRVQSHLSVNDNPALAIDQIILP